MRLIKAAVHHVGILRHVAIRNRGADWRSGWCGRGRYRRGSALLDNALLDSVLLDATLNGRARFLLGLGRRLAMGDELRIAWAARPRRHIGGHAAGPMRPMIGDKAAAARQIKPKSEQSYRCNEPPRSHRGCQMSRSRIDIPMRRDG
jgi:hypothetical protein